MRASQVSALTPDPLTAQTHSPRRRRLLLAGLTAALPAGLLHGASVAADAPAGPAEPLFSTTDLDWFDPERSRQVPVRLYLPLVASSEQPVPLVVFSHGIGGSREGYSYLGRHWASQGLASLHLQHVVSDRSLWTGNPFGLAGRLHDAAQAREAESRVRDLRFALDRMLGGEMGSRIDPGRIAAAGHSYGANTTLLAIGARVERNGEERSFRDPRIKAAIVISSPPFYGQVSLARILGGVMVPSLHITSTDDVIRVPGYYSAAADRVAVFEAIGGSPKMLAVFAGGSHNIFSDRPTSGGAMLNPQVKLATQALSLAFLCSRFDGTDDALREWPREFDSLLARYVAGTP